MCSVLWAHRGLGSLFQGREGVRVTGKRASEAFTGVRVGISAGVGTWSLLRGGGANF